jgi:signal peptide peptidase SppA
MGSRRYTRILKFISEHPWAILPARLDSIVEMLELRAAGTMFTDEEIKARIGAGPRGTGNGTVPASGRPIAVLPLYGVIAPRTNMMTDISGGTSAEAFGRAFRALIADPEISAVVLDVDSPGGSVFGIEELANIIRSARGRKPIVAVADTMMASAAYWIAAQADEIIASPSSQVGSIGVIGVHQDISKAEAADGITTTLVTAGKFKGDGNEHQPLSDTARAAMQHMVDSYYAAFTRDVGKGRAVSAADIRDGYGEGRVLGADAAFKAGLTDGTGTLEQVIARLASGSKRVGMKAEVLDEIHESPDRPLTVVTKANGTNPAPEPAPSEPDPEIEDFRRRLAAYH